MHHGQLFALGGIEVSAGVGVVGDDDLALKGADAVAHRRHNRHRLGGAESAVHEILLHINYNEKVFHSVTSNSVKFLLEGGDGRLGFGQGRLVAGR